ncbi:MAG: HDIG domain-containing protein [Mediterranea sp.]|jgi:putative nucleotidyltransferase with HDIG domain|nr:HDIG domain-containing protein [Mediterranea sp.]
MKKSGSKRSYPYRDLLYKALIFIATVAVIAWFLPRDNKFNYQFDINKPWKYEQLIATFDFPIYKDAAVVKHEQDSIRAAFQPFFQLNKEIEKNALNKLKALHPSRHHTHHASVNYLNYLEKRLSEIYAVGVLSSEDISRLAKDSTATIMVVDDKLAKQYSTARLFSVKDAYAYVLYGDSTHYSPQVLSRYTLSEYIFPNLIYDQQRTETAEKEMFNNFSWANGIVLSGQKIVDRGEIVGRQTYDILKSLQQESLKRNEGIGQRHLILIGQILFVAIIMLFFMLYLDLFRKDYYEHKGSLSLLFILIVFYSVATSLIAKHNVLSVYVIPYAMLPIIIRVFLDSRTAFHTYVVTLLICSIGLNAPYEFILLQVATGLVAIYSLRELSQRSQLFRTAFLIALTYVTLFFAYELTTENSLSKLNGTMYIYFLINSVLLLFAYPLLFALEKIFGFTSNVTLVELSNINNPLLRRMSETVPGTFQHSMQVANLAAEAANRIGAKSQLVRTGALYHDIGKMENPIYFTENQSGGVNPHKFLPYEQSAQIIISHVTDGLKLAEKYDLPTVIKDFIATHHGKGKVKYFYISWKNEHPDEEPNEALFTYPGPNPFTRETAILMMADAVEATSRSLPEYTEKKINALVDKIIDSQVEEGFFKECPITFKDIATVKSVFKEKLMTIYHTRITYPELKK